VGAGADSIKERSLAGEGDWRRFGSCAGEMRGWTGGSDF